MKKMILLLLLAASGTCEADDSATVALAKSISQAANLFTCDMFKGQKTAIAGAVGKNCHDRAQAEFNSLPDQRSLKDCIKPGNIIDDNVRKCMKGT